MSKFGGTPQKHKNSNNSVTNSSSDLKLKYKVPCIYVHILIKIPAPYLKQFKIYLKKCSFLTPFKTLAHLPFKTIVLCYYWVIQVYVLTIHPCKGKYSYEISFQDLLKTQDPCTGSAEKPIWNTDLNHFKTLVLVSLQHNGQWTAHISTTAVWLERWQPATCFWWVERSDHTCIMSIQHQEGNMVCNNCRLSR